MSALVKNGDLVPDSECLVSKHQTFLALLGVGVSEKVAEETTEANFKSPSCSKCPEQINLFEMNMIRRPGAKQRQGFDEPQEHFRSTGIRDGDEPDVLRWDFAERSCLDRNTPDSEWTQSENQCLALLWDRDPGHGLPTPSNDVNIDKRPKQCPDERGPCTQSQLHGAINFMFQEFGTPTGRNALLPQEEYKQLWLDGEYPEGFKLRSPRSCKRDVTDEHFGCKRCLSDGGVDSHGVNQQYCRCVIASSHTLEWQRDDAETFEHISMVRQSFAEQCGALVFPGDAFAALSIASLHLDEESDSPAEGQQCEPFCAADGSFFGQ